MSIGEWDYKGRCVAQARGVPELLDEVGHELKSSGNLPTSIIEIGTYHGGFTTMLMDSVLSENCEKILTLDVYDRSGLADYFSGTKVDFRIFNAFKSEGVNIIQKEILRKGKCMVFCDGGNKGKEFAYVAAMLKKGDFVLAHDYAHDVNFFVTELRDVVWNWFELEYGRIKGACEANDLKRCEFSDRFEKKAWACFQREE